jgi:hypothetical protein
MLSSARLRTLTATTLVALAVACSSDMTSSDGPGSVRPAAELTVVQLSPTAPPLESDTASFWAVKGQGAEQRLYFLDDQGQRGEEYMSLKLSNESLSRRPDGSAIAEGDSVLISIRVVDPVQVLFELQPTGLQFSTTDPAELKIRYAEANGDFNDDGEVDHADSTAEAALGIWRQEHVGDPFVRLGSVKVADDKAFEAKLTGFSRYAIAY